MQVVAALGGNALAARGQPATSDRQVARVRVATAALAALVRQGHELVVTHGNGPQVGLLAARSGGMPLDVIGAETEGMIGYWIERELANHLPDRDIAALLTQVVVDPDDPAFAEPSKPIGAVYPAARAEELKRTRGWAMIPEADGFRRVVPSPAPHDIVELNTIELLVRAGVIVVCGGGGGIPVVRDRAGALHGCEAVIDKDAFSALLAERLGADCLLLLTDVDAVLEDWPEPGERPIRRATPEELRAHSFAPGSMAPKVEAACRFVERTRARAAIGRLEDAEQILAGHAGTAIEWQAGS